MFKQVCAVALTLSVVLLIGCSAAKITVETDRGIDGPHYKFYRWSESVAISGDGQFGNIAVVDKILRREVDKLMAKKGFVARSDGAQLILDYRLTEQIAIDQGGVISPTDEARRAWDTRDNPASTAIHDHQVPQQLRSAVVILMASDAKTQQVLWQGRGVKLMEKEYPSDGERKALIRDLVSQLMKAFPSR